MIRPILALALARAANAVVPKCEPATIIDRVRWRMALVLIDASLRTDGRPPLADALADLTEPPATLRSRTSGGRR